MLAERLLAPMREAEVDALLLGCTHYPFLARTISDVMGPTVTLVSSADETAFAVARPRSPSSACCATHGRGPAATASSRAATSTWFRELGGRLLGPELDHTERWDRPHRSIPTTDQQEHPMTRPDGRAADELRPISFERDFTEMAAGSCSSRSAAPACCARRSIDEDVPRWMRGSGKGWVTAEYSMLPGIVARARRPRGGARASRAAAPIEIQRLIGRSLRAACDMTVLGERQVIVDCDVLQADGGTRTAIICGGYLALHDALARVVQRGGADRPTRCTRSARRSASASSTARRCSTCPTSRTAGPRST